jgi:hypothetical protein
MPLQIPRLGETAARGKVELMSDQELIAVAREIAGVMRGFEAVNQEQLGQSVASGKSTDRAKILSVCL